MEQDDGIKHKILLMLFTNKLPPNICKKKRIIRYLLKEVFFFFFFFFSYILYSIYRKKIHYAICNDKNSQNIAKGNFCFCSIAPPLFLYYIILFFSSGSFIHYLDLYCLSGKGALDKTLLFPLFPSFFQFLPFPFLLLLL